MVDRGWCRSIVGAWQGHAANNEAGGWCSDRRKISRAQARCFSEGSQAAVSLEGFTHSSMQVITGSHLAAFFVPKAYREQWRCDWLGRRKECRWAVLLLLMLATVDLRIRVRHRIPRADHEISY